VLRRDSCRAAAGGYGGVWAEGGLAVDSRGDCITAEGFDHVLCVAWRGDNDGEGSSRCTLAPDLSGQLLCCVW
jgi:hypothetical protein